MAVKLFSQHKVPENLVAKLTKQCFEVPKTEWGRDHTRLQLLS